MSEQNKLNELIAAAEKEVLDSKTNREEALQNIMKDESSREIPIKPQNHKEGNIQNNWTPSSNSNETETDRKRKMLIYACIILIIAAGAALWISLHLSLVGEEKDRKLSSELLLSRVRVGEKTEDQRDSALREQRESLEDSKEETRDTSNTVTTNFSGVKDGVLYHNGEPSAAPPAAIGMPHITGNIQEMRREARREIERKTKAVETDKIDGIEDESEKIETRTRVFTADEESALDMPPDTSPRVLEHLRKKAEEEALQEDKDNEIERPAENHPAVKKGDVILSW